MFNLWKFISGRIKNHLTTPLRFNIQTISYFSVYRSRALVNTLWETYLARVRVRLPWFVIFFSWRAVLFVCALPFLWGLGRKTAHHNPSILGLNKRTCVRNKRIPPSVSLMSNSALWLRPWGSWGSDWLILYLCNWILLYDLFSGRLSVRSDKSALQFVKCVACWVMAWRAYTTLSLLDSMVGEGQKRCKHKDREKKKMRKVRLQVRSLPKKASEHARK